MATNPSISGNPKGVGRVWLWEHVHNEGHNMKWIVKTIKNGTTIWDVNRSHQQKITQTISDASWWMYCAWEHKKYGWFYDESPKASLCHGELLCLLAIHRLLSGLLAKYNIIDLFNKICYNNQDTLVKSSEQHQRILTGDPCTDICRSMSNLKSGIKMKYR